MQTIPFLAVWNSYTSSICSARKNMILRQQIVENFWCELWSYNITTVNASERLGKIQRVPDAEWLEGTSNGGVRSDMGPCL